MAKHNEYNTKLKSTSIGVAQVSSVEKVSCHFIIIEMVQTQYCAKVLIFVCSIMTPMNRCR